MKISAVSFFKKNNKTKQNKTKFLTPKETNFKKEMDIIP